MWRVHTLLQTFGHPVQKYVGVLYYSLKVRGCLVVLFELRELSSVIIVDGSQPVGQYSHYVECKIGIFINQYSELISIYTCQLYFGQCFSRGTAVA